MALPLTEATSVMWEFSPKGWSNPEIFSDHADLIFAVAFHQGLELSFVNGALTCISAFPLGLVLRTCDFNLAPSALVVVFSKIK